MEKIYSNIDPTKLLHIIVRKEDFKQGRQDIVDSDQWIQLSLLQMDKGKTFQPHHHIWNRREEAYIAQESWVVLSGMVKAILYDLDNSVLAEMILRECDLSITLEGGHNYIVLEDNSKVLEFKTGKYRGQEFDKQFIN